MICVHPWKTVTSITTSVVFVVALHCFVHFIFEFVRISFSYSVLFFSLRKPNRWDVTATFYSIFVHFSVSWLVTSFAQLFPQKSFSFFPIDLYTSNSFNAFGCTFMTAISSVLPSDHGSQHELPGATKSSQMKMYK